MGVSRLWLLTIFRNSKLLPFEDLTIESKNLRSLHRICLLSTTTVHVHVLLKHHRSVPPSFGRINPWFFLLSCSICPWSSLENSKPVWNCLGIFCCYKRWSFHWRHFVVIPIQCTPMICPSFWAFSWVREHLVRITNSWISSGCIDWRTCDTILSFRRVCFGSCRNVCCCKKRSRLSSFVTLETLRRVDSITKWLLRLWRITI